MYLFERLLFIVFFLFLLTHRGNAKSVFDSLKVHTDFIYLDANNKPVQDIYYIADTTFQGTIQLVCYRFLKPDDSILVYKKSSRELAFKHGIHYQRLTFNELADNNFLHPDFFEILKKTGGAPAGEYRQYIKISTADSTFYTAHINSIDSTLSPNSSIRKEFNEALMPKPKTILGIDIGKQVNSRVPVDKILNQSHKKMDKAFKKQGISIVSYANGSLEYIDFYCKGWFVGRCMEHKDESFSKQVQKEQHTLLKNPVSLTNDDLETHPSLFSQLKELRGDKNKEHEMEGELGLTTNASSGQEQYSGTDNNYYELRGQLSVPIGGLPFRIEGFYTSQDANRPVKSSFISVHYDVDKAKDELMKSIDAYKTKFSETQSKTTGLQSVYQTYINNLEAQKGKLLDEIKKEESKAAAPPGKEAPGALQATGIAEAKAKMPAKDSASSGDSTRTTGTDKDKEAKAAVNEAKEKEAAAINKADNAAYAVRQKETAYQQKANEKYKKLEELEKKIQKYQALLAQYKNTNKFDSQLVYNKVKGLDNTNDLSYKQMAQKADNLLPDGHFKKFISGVTSFDAGMINQYQSKYTMSGQMLKGIALGYDLGFCKSSFSVGQTQYIGADGNVDKYFCYSGKFIFQPVKDEQVGLTYYGYMPGRQMLSNEQFFKDANMAAPGFKDPVHIFSVDYQGRISKDLTLNGELATCLKNTDAYTRNSSLGWAGKSAYTLNITGNIPHTPVSLAGTYQNTGNAFENNTLPVSTAGLEEYQLSGNTSFFKSVLSVGIEYDYMLQHSFASTAKSNKWGFDIRENLKKYPSASLSYKPFSTFRSYTDTLNVPQRPLFGAVWVGQLSYQMKIVPGRSLRFSFVYNRNTSIMDTVRYGSTTSQFMCIYTAGKLTSSAIIAYSNLSGSNAPVLAQMPNNTYLLSTTCNYMLDKQLSIGGGDDLGLSDFGFCRFSLSGNISYLLKKLPIMTRLNMRYNTYQLNVDNPWTNIYSGSLDIAWKFKAKTTKKFSS